MFKKIFFLLSIMQFSFSQERELIQGKVIYRNIDVPAANVINNTSQISTITNNQGEFEIFAKEGDEIIFSSVQYIIRTVKVNAEILKNKRIIVQINQRVRELDEVVITPDDTDKFLDLKEEQFKDFKNGKLKIISFYAKKARGLMTRFLIDNDIKKLSDIESFNSSGYMFSQNETRNPLEPVFVR